MLDFLATVLGLIVIGLFAGVVYLVKKYTICDWAESIFLTIVGLVVLVLLLGLSHDLGMELIKNFTK